MTAQRAVPRVEDLDTANNRLKNRFRSLFWSSMIFAVIAHFGAFTYWPQLTTQDFSFTPEELTAIELPPEVEIPPPPASIARPAVPVISTTMVDEDITIAPTTFETNPVETLPPPPETTGKIADVADHPTFTPFTVAPEILNRDEIVRAMLKEYPPLLRDSGIGGVVQVYFFIDDDGIVEKTQVHASSGYQLLDDAALAVADLYRFSPALNRDTKVPVWVSFPIEFRVIH